MVGTGQAASSSAALVAALLPPQAPSQTLGPGRKQRHDFAALHVAGVSALLVAAAVASLASQRAGAAHGCAGLHPTCRRSRRRCHLRCRAGRGAARGRGVMRQRHCQPGAAGGATTPSCHRYPSVRQPASQPARAGTQAAREGNQQAHLLAAAAATGRGAALGRAWMKGGPRAGRLQQGPRGPGDSRQEPTNQHAHAPRPVGGPRPAGALLVTSGYFPNNARCPASTHPGARILHVARLQVGRCSLKRSQTAPASARCRTEPDCRQPPLLLQASPGPFAVSTPCSAQI